MSRFCRIAFSCSRNIWLMRCSTTSRTVVRSSFAASISTARYARDRPETVSRQAANYFLGVRRSPSGRMSPAWRGCRPKSPSMQRPEETKARSRMADGRPTARADPRRCQGRLRLAGTPARGDRCDKPTWLALSHSTSALICASSGVTRRITGPVLKGAIHGSPTDP